MGDNVSVNIVVQWRKRGIFVGFSGDRMYSLIEGMWNKAEYDLKGSQIIFHLIPHSFNQ